MRAPESDKHQYARQDSNLLAPSHNPPQNKTVTETGETDVTISGTKKVGEQASAADLLTIGSPLTKPNGPVFAAVTYSIAFIQHQSASVKCGKININMI